MLSLALLGVVRRSWHPSGTNSPLGCHPVSRDTGSEEGTMRQRVLMFMTLESNVKLRHDVCRASFVHDDMQI